MSEFKTTLPHGKSDIRKRSKMQASQNQALTLCHIFEERQEFIWGFDDDYELEDGSCQSGMLSKASIRMPTIQEQTSPTKICNNLPLCSQRACCVKDLRTSFAFEKKGGSNAYIRTSERMNYSSDGSPPVGLYEDEEPESSSEEEDYALDARFDAQEGSLPKRVIYRARTVPAAQFHGVACNEITPLPRRGDRRTNRVVMPEQGRDRQRFSRFQVQGSSQRYSHNTAAAATQRGSYQQANTPGYLPHQVQLTHQPTEGRNSPPGLAQARGRVYSQQRAGARECEYQTQPRIRSHPHHQVMYRNEKRVSSRTSKMYILMEQSTEVNEIRLAAPQTKECNNRGENTRPPVQQRSPRQRIAVVARPNDMKTNQEREHQPRQLPVRRTGRQETYSERNDHVRRRIGVCSETDATKEHRMFVRVLHKRF